MKKEINNNDIYTSAYRNRQASENVIRGMSSFYIISLTGEFWRNCGDVRVC
jgi:hypothetical protein